MTDERGPDERGPDERGPAAAAPAESQVTPSSTAVGGKPARSVEDRDPPARPDPDRAAGPPHGADLAREALAEARAMSARNRNARGGDGTDARRQRRRQRNRAANTAGAAWSGPGADSRDPQAAGAVLKALFTERGWHQPVAEARVFADWAGLVGADIAAQCTPVSLRDGELRVTARSSAWATQLRLLAPTLLARLAAQLGAGVVKRLVVSGPTGPSWKHGSRSVPGARGPRDTYG